MRQCVVLPLQGHIQPGASSIGRSDAVIAGLHAGAKGIKSLEFTQRIKTFEVPKTEELKFPLKIFVYPYHG